MRHKKTKIALVAGVLTLYAGLGLAQQPAPIEHNSGKSEYMTACASCHGTRGLGDGPMAEFMTSRIADLTMLARNNDGEFPMLSVIHILDGRTGLRGHGSEMPVWGDIFKAEAGQSGNYAAELTARGRLLLVAYHLESLQK